MKLGFVTPRYGKEIAGGAETLVRELAEKLSLQHEIEIFTTCAVDNRTWDNVLKPGVTKEENIKINRFLVSPRDLEVWIPRQIAISEGQRLSLSDQLSWMEHGVNSLDLYSELVKRKDEFTVFMFAPYLFGTSFYGALAVKEKAFLIPCLHDEEYAYLEITKHLFLETKGSLFNSLPEKELAEKLYGQESIRGGVVGMGFEMLSKSYIDSLEKITTIQNKKIPEKYIICVGRKETGKNAHTLLDYFVASKENNQIPKDLSIILVGGGSFEDLLRPQFKDRSDIIDLSYISESEKQSLIKYASCLVQPSVLESFSIVLMEAWRLGTPVIVNAAGAVTKHHTEISGGGLWFDDDQELAACINQILDPEIRSDLSLAGYRYVESEFAWEEVVNRFNSLLLGITLKKN